MTRRFLFAFLAAGCIAGLQLSAQPQAPESSATVSFEAASIKPTATSDGNSFVRRMPGGRFDAHNVATRFLITFAYQLQPFQIVGDPTWVGNDRFDIIAKMEGDPPPTALKPSTTDCAAEAKRMGRGGPPPAPNDPVACGSRQNFGRIKFGGMPLSVFATNISGQLGRTVVDRTGLSGNWDFEPPE